MVKTTAINGVIKTIVSAMTSKDVMVVFDAKGDFKKEFYRPGVDQIVSCSWRWQRQFGMSLGKLS